MAKKKKEESENKKPLILVTNDDGIDSKGIRALGEIARKFGRVVMVGPASGRSGMSHAVTCVNPLRLRRIYNSPDLEIYKTNGTTADAVKLAQRHLLKDEKIDLLLSGINHGANTSVSVIYSSTVAGAVEGCLSRIPSIAFSVVDYTSSYDFKSASTPIEKIIGEVMRKGLPKHICLNVNIPNIPTEKIRGIKVTRQALNYWYEELEHRNDPANIPYFWMNGYLHEIDKGKDTDHWAVKHNYVSVHPIRVDWTDHVMVQELKKWDFKF